MRKTLLDASVNFEMNNWRFALFGRNLSDEDGYTHGYDVAGLVVIRRRSERPVPLVLRRSTSLVTETPSWR